jgi:hypothetical protein
MKLSEQTKLRLAEISPQARALYEAVGDWDEKSKIPGFWPKLKAMCAEADGMREANTTGNLSQLLRPETQRVADSWYEENQDKFTWSKWCLTVNSNKQVEIYNPLMTAPFAAQTAEQEPYPETNVIGINIPIPNLIWKSGVAFSREMFDWDQTGQIRSYQRRLAEAQLRTKEAFFALRIRGVAGSFGPLSVPASNWPNLADAVNSLGNAVGAVWTPTGTSGIGNQLTTMGALSTARLKAAEDLLLLMTDRQGTPLGLTADTLLVSTKDMRHAQIIMNGGFYPSVIGRSGDTWNTAQSAFAGGVNSINPWQGAYEVIVNRFLASWAWYLGMKGYDLVHQINAPLEVIQELPQAGKSYETQSYRFQSYTRWNTDFVDVRHAVQGDDGSVPGSF